MFSHMFLGSDSLKLLAWKMATGYIIVYYLSLAGYTVFGDSFNLIVARWCEWGKLAC